jgi:transposase-like protein
MKASAVKTYFLIGCKLDETAQQAGIHRRTLAQWIKQLQNKLDLHDSDENYSASQDFS